MAEFDSVREEKGLSGGVDDIRAMVVFKGGDDIEAIGTTEGQGLARAGFVVDDDRASDGADGSGVEVEGAVAVFLSWHVGVEGGLTK